MQAPQRFSDILLIFGPFIDLNQQVVYVHNDKSIKSGCLLVVQSIASSRIMHGVKKRGLGTKNNGYMHCYMHISVDCYLLFHNELTSATNVESGSQTALVGDAHALQCVNGVVACSIAGDVGTDADALNAGSGPGYGNIQRGINAAVLCRVVDTIRRKFRAILHEMRAVGHQVRAVVVAADGSKRRMARCFGH